MPRVDLIKRPAVTGTVPRAMVLEFVQAMGLDPREARSIVADPDKISVEVFHRDADGRRWVFPNGEPATYTVERVIT